MSECWPVTHFDQNFNCHTVHVPISSLSSTNKYGISFVVKWCGLSFSTLRFAQDVSIDPKPRFHATSGNTLNRYIWGRGVVAVFEYEYECGQGGI